MNERATQYLIYAAIAITAVVAGLSLGGAFDKEANNPSWKSVISEGANTPSCNVSVVRLEGPLDTYSSGGSADPSDPNSGIGEMSVDSESIVTAIEDADADPTIKGLVLQIDSTGGSPVAAEEISNALKRSSKPTVALIRGAGLSAAYWAATGANIIIAAENSEVGSIGVTSSYIDQAKHNSQSGYTYNTLSTGEFKDMLNSNKPLTDSERELVKHELAIVFANFVKTVNYNRRLSLEASSSPLTTGASFIASEALEAHLIDRIGDKETARSYFAEMLALPSGGVSFCE